VFNGGGVLGISTSILWLIIAVGVVLWKANGRNS